jgi:hypothetical protein
MCAGICVCVIGDVAKRKRYLGSRKNNRRRRGLKGFLSRGAKIKEVLGPAV